MSWSRAEVSALAAKAARGAGAAAGQAALFGQAAALHLGQGREAEVLSDALAALPTGPINALPLVVQKVLPVAQAGGEVEVEWGGDCDLARSYLDTVPGRFTLRASGKDKLRLAFALCDARPSLQRITGCGALMAQMTKLAARTFVPESAVSRLSGAGAGLRDND